MNEILLQFIWQYSLYNPQQLFTTTGEPVTIVHPGRRNTDAGPDFCEARIRIGQTLWVGNVEIHVQTSHWQQHGHQRDAAYHNIILHVVYRNDVASPPDQFPLLELGAHIPQYIIRQYTHLIRTDQRLPCATELHRISSIGKESWLNRLLAERWEQRLSEWQELLNRSAGDWQLLFYWVLAGNFGFRVNAAAFMQMAQSLPLHTLAKHRNNAVQTEALLFGQAGFLEQDFEETYPQALQKEYRYLRQKYSLKPVPVHLWKFLRMRPANFPTVRIAQFAALIQQSVHLFSQLVESTSVAEMSQLFDVTAGEYWDTHCRFDEVQKTVQPKHMGQSSVHNIIINTVAPIRFLYALHHGQQRQQELALQLLEQIPAEQNNVLSIWEQHGWPAANAAQSQAQIQLFRHYCSSKRCLECSIGLSIIRSRPDK
jgi:hypothetical protein